MATISGGAFLGSPRPAALSLSRGSAWRLGHVEPVIQRPRCHVPRRLPAQLDVKVNRQLVDPFPWLGSQGDAAVGSTIQLELAVQEEIAIGLLCEHPAALG